MKRISFRYKGQYLMGNITRLNNHTEDLAWSDLTSENEESIHTWIPR